MTRSASLALALALAATVSCATSARAPSPRAVAARRPPPTLDPAVESLARMLPPSSERCSISQPSLLPAEQRPLLSLVSQNEVLPWSLPLDVIAHARAERAPELGQRAVVELVRFAVADRAGIERALAASLARALTWDDAESTGPDACAGELTCSALHARFVDPRTVQLTHGAWGVDEAADSPCLDVLRGSPQALEVSARAAFLSGTELRDSRAQLVVSPSGLHALDGIVRTTQRRYAAPEAAERAMHDALLGHDELVALAGVPATSLGEREADVVSQSSFVSFDDLRMALLDRARAGALFERASEPPEIERVDPADTEAVRAAYDAQLQRLRGRPTAAELAPLTRLLERARARSPDDVGLCRRHYQLALTLQRDPRAAYAVARDALARKLPDPPAWQLRARAALALFDEAGLRSALSTAHALTPAAAARMARVLSERARRGADYERAEWAQLAAQRLARQSLRARRAPVSLPLRLTELPRLFAYLAQSQLPQLDLGVHLLVTADQLRAADVTHSASELPWVEDTTSSARPAVMLAATSWDDTQLRALGSALGRRSDDGALELVLGFEAIGGRQRTMLLIAGRRAGATLRIEQLSASLSRLDWARIERLLAAPLRALVGSTFPPDELVVTALDAAEATRIASAAEAASSVSCSFDGLTVHCRGPLADAQAARRALLAVTAALLRDEAAALWSGTD